MEGSESSDVEGFTLMEVEMFVATVTIFQDTFRQSCKLPLTDIHIHL